MGKGLFISLEGIDGSGTTTQVREVCKMFKSRNDIEVHTTYEPYDNKIGKIIRDDIRSGYARGYAGEMALMFAANRLWHYNNKIKPALDAGKIIISDRAIHSSLAYQSADMGDDYMGWLESINSLTPYPDATIFLKVGPDVAGNRMMSRPLRDSYEELEFQKKVFVKYLEIMGDCDKSDVLIIPELSISATSEIVYDFIESKRN